MISIRYVKEEDSTFWFSLDEHISKSEFEKKVRDHMGYVMLENDKPIGILRYNLFWDNTPFCTMLYIDPNYQQKGYGKTLMLFWESEMKQKGYGMIMTSTQVDEGGQHFYRKIGYQDAGGLLINIPGYEQPMGLFFTKKI